MGVTLIGRIMQVKAKGLVLVSVYFAHRDGAPRQEFLY